MPASNVQMLSALSGVHALMNRDFDKFWSRLDLSNPTAVRNLTLGIAPALVDTHGERAAILAADWYDDLRYTQGVGRPYRSTLAAGAPAEQVTQRMRFGAKSLWDGTPIEFKLFAANAMSGYITQRFGDTITHNTRRDPVAVGWERVTEPGACKFCIMLAGRGGVYKRGTAIFAAHSGCKCGARPSWDVNAQEVPVSAYRESERIAGLRRRAASGDSQSQEILAEHNARAREWIAAYL